jgi:hypothetical protein
MRAPGGLATADERVPALRLESESDWIDNPVLVSYSKQPRKRLTDHGFLRVAKINWFAGSFEAWEISGNL